MQTKKNDYSHLTNFEHHKEVIEKLYQFNIEFSDLIEMDYELFQSLLEKTDLSLIDNFWNELQNYKAFHTYSQDLCRFIDVLEILNKEKIELYDLHELDDESIYIILEDLPKDKINNFLKAFRKKEKESVDSISNYFIQRKIFDEYSNLIKQINTKGITFENILAMENESLNSFLESLNCENSLKDDFSCIISMEKFFKKNNFINGFYENIKNVCFEKKIFLEKLSKFSNDKVLEVLLFLLFTDFYEILPKDFIKFILENEFTIMKIGQIKDDELTKLELKSEDITLIRNTIEIFKNCQLRNFNFFDLEHSFVRYVSRKGISIEKIDNWKDNDYDFVPNLKDKEKIIKLFKNKSETELFFAEENIPDNQVIFDKLIYIDLITLREWDMNNLIKKLGGKNLNLYKKIINKIKTSYKPIDNLLLKNRISEFESKMKEFYQLGLKEKNGHKKLEILKIELKNRSLNLGSILKKNDFNELNNRYACGITNQKNPLFKERDENKLDILKGLKFVPKDEKTLEKQTKLKIEFESKLLNFENNKASDKKEFMIIFKNYLKIQPEDALNYYKLKRKSLPENLEFFFEDEFIIDILDYLKQKLFSQFNESEKGIYRIKIDDLFYNLKNDRENFLESFLNSFSNQKHAKTFSDILVLLEENIPFLFDKLFPSYFQLFIKYKKKPKIFESLISLSKELIEIKNKQESIMEIKKSIQCLGKNQLNEIFRSFPELENFIDKKDNSNSQNSLNELLTNYLENIGISFYNILLTKNPQLAEIVKDMNIDSKCNLNSDNLEEMIKNFNDKFGEFFILQLFENCSELKFNIEFKKSEPIQNLLSRINNEVDPYFLDHFYENYPQFKEIKIERYHKTTDNISFLISNLNEQVGFQYVQKLLEENPELNNIFKITPNEIGKHDYREMNFIEKYFPNNTKEIEKLSSKIKNCAEWKKKLDKFYEIKNKIKEKLSLKTKYFMELKQMMSEHQIEMKKILLTGLSLKKELETKINKLVVLPDKDQMEYIKKNILILINSLKELLNIIKGLESKHCNIVTEIYEIYPDIAKLITPPKNYDMIIIEERKEIDSLLRNDKENFSLSISDLLEIDYENDNEKMLQNIINDCRNNKSILQLMISLFFDCVKRKELFNENLRIIEKSVPNFKINSSNLLEKLLSESTSNLKIMILQICAKYMPIPFLCKDYSLQKNNNIIDIYKVFPELVFILDDSSSNLLSFCLSDNRIDYPKGKSHILNYFFGRNFLIEENLKTKTTIEFQFDQNYGQPMKFNIADYHGTADDNIIHNLVRFFNYYILHIRDNEYIEKRQIISSIIEAIKKTHSEFILIVLIHHEGYNKIEIKDEKNVFYFKINCIRPMSMETLKNLKDEIWKIIIRDFKEFQFFKINSVKEKYINVIANFYKDGVNKFEEKLKNIKEFINFVGKYKEDFLDKDFLPFNYYFVKFSDKSKELDQNYDKYDEETKKQRQIEIEELYSNLKFQKKSKIVDLFWNLSSDDLFLGNLMDSSSRVKNLIDSNLADLYKKRNKIFEEISKNIEESEIVEFEKEKKQIMEKINQRTFSYEILVRELYHIQKHNSMEILPEEKSYFQKVSNQMINCGQPFEIIDGDNLHFISDFYPYIFQTDECSILVISIIGPQSSGKSTLLNFLFGTQFASSAGRCTKGMYGAIMNVKNHSKFKKILILDTEGILSAERNDHLFDKKLILFCLCVSHVTILCNKGDIHKGMTDILKLTKECMKDLNDQKFNDPNIFVVLNALTDINDKLMLPFQNLEVKLTDVIKLPFAYEMKDVYLDVKINVPSTSFCKKCSDFRKQILNLNIDEEKNKYNLSKWFEFSQKLWEKVDKFKNLINFDIVEEMVQDKILQEIIETLFIKFKNSFGDKNDKKNLVKDIIDNYKKKLSIENFNQIYNDVFHVIESKTLVKLEEILKIYEKESRNKNINLELMKKRKINFEKSLNLVIEDFKFYASKILNEKKKKYSKGGDRERNKFIDRLLESNNNLPFAQSEASMQFNKFWENFVLKPLEKLRKPFKDMKEQCFRDVMRNYQFCIDDKVCDPIVEEKLRKFFDDFNEDIILNVFTNDLILSFKEGSIPEIDELFKLNNQQGKYFNIDKKIFDKKEIFKICQIDCKEGFNRDIVLAEILKNFEEKKDQLINEEFHTKSYCLDKIEKCLLKIKKECELLGIEFTYNDDFVKIWSKKLDNSNLNNENFKENVNYFIDEILSKFNLIRKDTYKKSFDIFYFFNAQKLYKYFDFSPDEYEKYKGAPDWFLIKKIPQFLVNEEFNIDEKNFLNWYIKPNDPAFRMNEEKINIGVKFIKNFFNWKNILNQIYLIVYRSIHVNSNTEEIDFPKKLEFIRKAIKSNNNIDYFIKEFSDLSSRNFKDMKNKIESLVEEINKEIAQFRFKLNTRAEGIFDETVKVLFWTMYTFIEYYRESEVLRINSKNFKEVKNFFISSLTKNKRLKEKSSSKLLINNILNSIYEHLKSKLKIEYEDRMKNYEKEFQSNKMQDNIDKLMKIPDPHCINRIMEYILDPIKQMDLFFEKNWNEKHSGVLKYIENSWLDEVKNKINSLEVFFKNAYEKMKSLDLLKESTNLFLYHDGNLINSNHIEKYEKWFEDFIVRYFAESVEGKWMDGLMSLNDNIKVKTLKKFPTLDKINDEFLQKILINQLKTKTNISNVETFLNEIISSIDEEKLSYLNNFPKNFEINIKKSFEQNFKGCDSFCPLCRKKCDVNHLNNSFLKHMCKTGHQFKVFGGSKLENNQPSFITCDLMKDNDIIICEGQKIKWSDFKEKNKKWEYENDEKLSERNLEKNKEIWRLIGRNLCDYYSQKDNIIIYSDWKNREYKKINLIFLLDSSSSMGGDKWYKLIKAVNDTFKFIIDDKDLKNSVKATIITYNTSAHVCIEKKTPYLDFMKDIIFLGGETNFVKPLEKLYDCIKSCKDEFDYFCVGFMSDGKANYPEKILNQINQDCIKDRIRFSSIYFGDDKKFEKKDVIQLKRIAEALNGKFTHAISVDDLKISFKEVINIGFK